ncbi:MAG TPA: site-2 protease family protein [Firmicutes bacterium]|nr:site-2 protease family protein [Bacillota bacterium]
MLTRFTPDIFLALPALLIALTFHEYAHAWAADRLGDPTPRMRGRLTLNPIAHIDPIGLLMLLLFRFGWAKPVEVNPYNFDNREQGMAWVSLAGPGINLLLGFVATLLRLLLLYNTGYTPLVKLLEWLIIYNVYLAVFNLIPIPPLDGSKLLFFFLPRGTVYRYLDTISQYGFIILVLAVSSGLVGKTIGRIADGILFLYDRVIFTLLGLW